MNSLMKFWREVKRLLRERVTLLFIALTAAGAVWFCLNSAGSTASDAYILNAAENSAILGALLFTLLTLFQFHRDYKNNTDSIILTCTDPVFYQLRRTLALICSAVVTTLIVTLFALPYALIKTGSYFQASAFAASWYLIFLGALVLSILLSSGLYMLTRRVEAAFIIMAGLIILSKMLEYQYNLNPSYMLFWVQTNASNFSDLVSNQFQIDAILWNRLFCMLAALGMWFLGLCCLRRYGRGVFGSFVSNSRRIWVPVLLVAAIILSGVSYAGEPIFDNSASADFNDNSEYNSETGWAVFTFDDEEEENAGLLLTDKQADVSIDTDSRTVSGSAIYTFQNLTGEEQDLSLIMNTGYTLDKILVNDQPTEAVRDDVEENATATWHIVLPACEEAVVELSYGGGIKNDGSMSQTVYDGICDEYVSVTPTCFSPNTETSVSEDFSFSWTLAIDESLSLTPEFSGTPAEAISTSDGKTTWGGSGTDYINVNLTAADYHKQTFEAGGLTIDFLYFAKHEDEIADMDVVNVMKAAIDYFTEAYGPLSYDDHLTILELPASYSGGYAAGNTSAMDETCFAAAGYLPTEGDNPDNGSGINTIIHEIAHQWWGLATYPITDDTSCWSAEGITCYSTYRFIEYYYGEEYAKEYFIDEWQTNWETYKDAFYVQHPEYLAKLSEDDASNVMLSLQSIALYDIMPLQLLKAEEALGGPDAFMEKLSELYQNYLFEDITDQDFLSVTGLSEEALDIA